MVLPSSPIFFLPDEVKAALIFLLRNAAHPVEGPALQSLPREGAGWELRDFSPLLRSNCFTKSMAFRQAT